MEYEIQLDKIVGERTDVHDSLVKKETIASNLELDKKKLQEDLKKVSMFTLIIFVKFFSC